MMGAFLALGLATLVLLLVIDGRAELRRDAKRWLVSRSALMPGVAIASAAVVVASWFPEATAAPGYRWVSLLAPGVLAAAFLLVVVRFRPRGRSTSRSSR